MKKLITMSLLLGLVASCGKKPSLVDGDPHQKEIEKSFNIFEDQKTLFGASSDSPYTERLLKCALQKEGEDCKPENVPLLGMNDKELTPDYILKNTLVSHEFLAKNFKDYLNNVNNKYLLNLFASVSGVVITDEISSSFYYWPTGMIYINANYLWKTKKEFAELKFKKDGRFSRDERKKVLIDMYYIKDNKYTYVEARKEERTLEDLSPSLTRLFFHELTHAADVYPADQLDSIDKTKKYLELRTERYETKEMVSRKIVYPETKKAWEYGVFYVEGELINPESHNFGKDDFLLDFAPNIAVIFYSYTTNREHLAMMMENYFMLFTEKFETCHYGSYRKSLDEDLEIFWFQKNRILQNNVLLEAKNAIDLMLPTAMADELTNIPTDSKLMTLDSPDSNFYGNCRND